MNEFQPPDPNEIEAKQQMLFRTLAGLVENEEFEFMNHMLEQQRLMSPAAIMVYMNDKRHLHEDPVEKRRWTFAIQNYGPTLAGQNFTPDEMQAIKVVRDHLEFDAIMANEDIGEEWKMLEPADGNEGLNEDEIGKVPPLLIT